MIYLPKIELGDTIGIVAPSSPGKSKDFILEKILEFKNLGYNVKLGDHLFDSKGFLAGSDFNRASDINNMFIDKEVKGIVCFRGGYGSIRTAPFLNIKDIKKNPKLFCGFSDITLLLNFISEKCHFPTFHGPMINSDFKDFLTNKYFNNLLLEDCKKVIYNLDDFNSVSVENSKDFCGKLIGGNLAVLCSSMNTPYGINITDDSILLIEEINEAPYAIDRLLTQLSYLRNFNKIKGIILGYFTSCTLDNYDQSFTWQEVIRNFITKFNIPIIINFPAGHDYPNIPLPIGESIKFSSLSNTISFISPFK